MGVDKPIFQVVGGILPVSPTRGNPVINKPQKSWGDYETTTSIQKMLFCIKINN